MAMIVFASLIAFVAALGKSWHYRKMKDESIEERGHKQFTSYHSFLEVRKWRTPKSLIMGPTLSKNPVITVVRLTLSAG